MRLSRPTPGDLIVSGPIDESDLGAFRVAVMELASEPSVCAVDLSGVTYLPSAAIGILVVARARARARGRRLSLRTVTDSISDQVLRVLGLSYDRLPVTDPAEAADLADVTDIADVADTAIHPDAVPVVDTGAADIA